MLAHEQISAQQLEPQSVSEDILESCTIEQLDATTVLFQSGYLTIDSVDDSHPEAITYQLVCPNHSVRSALQNNLFRHYTGNKG